MSDQYAYRASHPRDKRTYVVAATYPNATITIPLSVTKSQVYNATTTADTGQSIAIHYRRLAIQSFGDTCPALDIECSFDNSHWVVLPEDLCVQTSVTKNRLPSGGGLVFIDLPVACFLRLTASGLVAPDFAVVVRLDGTGEVGKAGSERNA